MAILPHGGGGTVLASPQAVAEPREQNVALAYTRRMFFLKSCVLRWRQALFRGQDLDGGSEGSSFSDLGAARSRLRSDFYDFGKYAWRLHESLILEPGGSPLSRHDAPCGFRCLDLTAYMK